MKPKWIRAFILSAGGILLAAALIRFIIAAGNAPVLAEPEPLLGITLRYALLLVGGFELVVGLICLFGKQVYLQLFLLAWLTANFVVYRIGLLTMHVYPKATCIGSLTDPLHFSGGITRDIVGLIPFYLLLGSYVLSIKLCISRDYRAERLAKARESANQRDTAAGLIKMSCPTCGGHIKFVSSNLGQEIPCPHCQKVITLSKPGNLKMACFFCKGNIEFPTHALGQKISCPHCSNQITLLKPA